MASSTGSSDRVRSRYANLGDATRCNPYCTVPAWCALSHTRTAMRLNPKEIFLMKTARSWGPGDIRIDDIPEPKTRPGTVKVEVEWCGICGTDLHEYLEGRSLLRMQALRTRSPARRCRPRSVTSSPG